MPSAISTARSYSLTCHEHACVHGVGRERECKLSWVLLDLLSHASALHFWADFSDLARAFHVATRPCACRDFRHSCYRMGHKCVVPNCNSGDASYKEKVTTFIVPSDPVKMETGSCNTKKRSRAHVSWLCLQEAFLGEPHKEAAILWRAWW